MKNVDLAQSIAGASILAIISMISLMPAARAVEKTGSGTYSGGACGPAQADFVDLTGAERVFGIDFTLTT